MRSYSVAIASLAIDAPHKWADNLLSQHSLPDVISARRGVPRRIPHHALVRLALIRELNTRLGIGVSDAISLAADMLANGSVGVLVSGPLSLRVDLAALERQLERRLADALESAPTPRRGRPVGRS